MANLTPEEVLENDKRVLGDKYGRTYNAIKNEYFRLNVKWREYKALFGVSQEQIDLLNKVAPYFFSRTQELMFNDIVLHINRMNYETKKGKYDYLSIRSLVDLETNATKKKVLKKPIDSSVAASRFTEDQRNRYLAHRSLELFTNPDARQLDSISDSEIEEAVKSLWNIVTFFDREHYNTSTIGEVFYPLGNASALIRRLKNSI